MPKRVDANQKVIVKVLRDCGLSVYHLHTVGHGCPDLLIGYEGKNYLVEVKDGSKPPSQTKLTPAEAIFLMNWRGQYIIIKSVVEALQFAQDIKAQIPNDLINYVA